MENLSLQNLPKAIGLLHEEVTQIKKSLLKPNNQKSSLSDEFWNNLTLENLPKAVDLLNEDMIQIKELILGFDKSSNDDTKIWFNVEELCKYLPDKPTKQTVYTWNSKGKIPRNKNEKKVRYNKAEIDEWLMRGRQNTIYDLERDVNNYLSQVSKRKKGNNGRR